MSNNSAQGEPYDPDDLPQEINDMWHMLGSAFRDYISATGDWVDGPESADMAMQMAARAEACFWRATGNMDAIDANLFIRKMRKADALLSEGSKGEANG